MAICPDCDEDHDAPGSLTNLGSQVKLRYRLFFALYFFALLSAGAGSYMVFGMGGVVLWAALFLLYFAHVNMTAQIDNMRYIRAADIKSHLKPELLPQKHGGTYL